MLCVRVRDNLINNLSENFSDVHCPGGVVSSSSHSCSCCCTVARAMLRGTVSNIMRTVLTTISNEFPLRQYASMIRCKGCVLGRYKYCNVYCRL